MHDTLVPDDQYVKEPRNDAIRTAKIGCSSSLSAVPVVSRNTQKMTGDEACRNENNDALDDVDQELDPD